jgi:glucose-1-phosphate cytidylyltransferase
MKVVVFAGGLGTRLAMGPAAVDFGPPKPLVRLGPSGPPILEEIIKGFADQGFGEFIIAGGYKARHIEKWRDAAIDALALEFPSITISVSDTGLLTQTGGRLLRMIDDLEDAPFIATYGDGLADVNLRMLIEHHNRMRSGFCDSCDPLVTLTASNIPSRFGRMRIEGGMATLFAEKGTDLNAWINIGYYVIQPEVLSLIPGDGCIFERDILPALALQGRLAAFQHPGQFEMMDTARDLDHLARLASPQAETAPFWRRFRAQEKP